MYLLQIKNSKKFEFIFKLKLLTINLKLKLLLLKKIKIDLKVRLVLLKKYLNFKNKEKLIYYIIKIVNKKNNIIFYVKNIKGFLISFFNAGIIGLTGKQKLKKPLLLLNLFKFFLKKFNKLSFNGLHLKNFKNYYSKFTYKILRKKIFIKTFKSYKIEPHNGCRPKKMKKNKGMTEWFKVVNCKFIR